MYTELRSVEAGAKDTDKYVHEYVGMYCILLLNAVFIG